MAQRASSPSSGRKIPGAAVARLPLYYRALLEVADDDIETVSSEQLALLAGVNAAQVRKDLSYLGSYGTRGVGYDVAFLLDRISRELGLTHDWPVVIVGVGNLGHALANYRGLGERGFRVLALVDTDPSKVGEKVGDLAVEPLDELAAIVRSRGITIGIIATPAVAAQDVADALVERGGGVDLELRARGDHGAGRGVGPQGRPRDRAPDLVVLPIPPPPQGAGVVSEARLSACGSGAERGHPARPVGPRGDKS